MEASGARHPAEPSSRRPADEELPPGLADHPDYEILRELGRGGMGVVYLARNKLMGRPEVLKVVSGHLLDRGNVRDRFLREIRNAAQLHHPNIVTAYSAVRAGDRIVLAMEYVEGQDLAQVIKERGPLPVAHACYFIYQAAQGLQHAHERGMVHRDIKPGNLILARDGNRATVKILDFGLAKATQEAPHEGGLTREGQMLGTPDYIAPEQSLDAQKADIRADIYSLGCTLYYLLTGGPPFEANSLYEILQAHHSREAQPLNLVRPDVPAALAALVAKMMAKAPGHRFQTPAEVAQALKPFLKPGGAGAVAQPAPTAPEPARRASTTPLPETIDMGPEEGLSPSPAPAKSPTSIRPAWLWFASGGAAVLLLGLVLARGLLVGDTATKRAETAPGPVVASPRDDERRPTEKAPVDEGPPRPTAPPPEEPPRLAVRKVEPDVPEVPRKEAPPAAKPAAEPVARVDRAEPRPEPEKKAPAVNRPGDFRQLRAANGPIRPANPGAEPPRLGFWPRIRPDDMTAWQVGDPGRIEMDREGIRLSAGPGGNFLLTRRDDFSSCTLKITLTAARGTEAFLALRAHHGPNGWRAITMRLSDDGGRIRVGSPSTDFQPPGRGSRPEIFEPGKSFRVTFQVDGKRSARLIVNQKEPSSTAFAETPAGEYVGAVGAFVKSGTLVIHTMDVQ